MLEIARDVNYSSTQAELNNKLHDVLAWAAPTLQRLSLVCECTNPPVDTLTPTNALIGLECP